MSDQLNLLVKHAVGGRTFLDSNKQTLEFQIEQLMDGWKFTIAVGKLGEKHEIMLRMAEIVKWKNELNVFIFTDEDGRAKKTWYYVKDGGVHYEEQQEVLTIIAHSKIDYYPDDY
jgi:alpha-L-arabinofuranosidase